MNYLIYRQRIRLPPKRHIVALMYSCEKQYDSILEIENNMSILNMHI